MHNQEYKIEYKIQLMCTVVHEFVVPTSPQMEECPMDHTHSGKRPIRFTPRLSLHPDHTMAKKRMRASTEGMWVGGWDMCVKCAGGRRVIDSM